MARREGEALYGGAAGGGKSEALVMEALRQVHIPHYKGLILRKTVPQLSELIEKTLRYYPRAFPGAKFMSQKNTWLFPSGARIVFGSLHRSEDRSAYQGRAFDFIGFDELTHFTWEEYSYLFSRARPNGPGTRVYIRATANPGGVGHGWVRERFITPAPPMTPITEDLRYFTPEGREELRRRRRIFVPASVFDNAALLANDPDYPARLAALPEAEKRALLLGDWSSFSGQVFTEWRDDPAHYSDRRFTHVVAPFRIPPDWRLLRGFDWGYARPFSVGWYALSPAGTLYRVREYYGSTGTPNEGVKLQPEALGRKIRQIEAEDENLAQRRIRGVADPAIFACSGQESIAGILARAGVFFDPGQNARISGKMQLHHRLAFDAQGYPRFQVFSTCRNFIRTLPGLVYDSSDVEDVDTRGEDHCYDECRYVLMDCPVTPPLKKPAPAQALPWPLRD